MQQPNPEFHEVYKQRDPPTGVVLYKKILKQNDKDYREGWGELGCTIEPLGEYI